jgi:D-psicose/D-tagatose/L-ribulose 3-epimerase
VEIALIDAVWEGTPLEGISGLLKAKEIGFEAIDVAFDPVGQTLEAVRQLTDDVRAVGLSARSVVCVSLGFAGDYNASVQRFHVERVKRHLDLAAELGARNLLLVIGEYIWQQEIISADTQWAAAVRNTREVSQYAQDLGLELALELEPWKYAFLNSISAAVRLMDDVESEACKVNLDLSHLWPMGVVPDQISALTGRISHAHISDCGGTVYQNLPPGRGTAPLREYLAALVKTGYGGTLSVELEPPPPGEDVEAWVREAHRETIKLMQETGAAQASEISSARSL